MERESDWRTMTILVKRAVYLSSHLKVGTIMLDTSSLVFS